jgi:hypothetical protein
MFTHSDDLSDCSANYEAEAATPQLADLVDGPFANALPDATAEAEDSLRISVEEGGILNPVRVRRNLDNQWEIIDGHRRKRLAVELGIECPIEIVEMGDEEALRSRCMNSVDWRGVTKTQIAEHYWRIHQHEGKSAAIVAEEISRLFGITMTRQAANTARQNLQQEGLEFPARTHGADGRERATSGRTRQAFGHVDPNVDAPTDDSQREQLHEELATRGLEIPSRPGTDSTDNSANTSECLVRVRQRLQRLTAMASPEHLSEANVEGLLLWRGVLDLAGTQARVACAIDTTYWNTVNKQWKTIQNLRNPNRQEESEETDYAN